MKTERGRGDGGGNGVGDGSWKSESRKEMRCSTKLWKGRNIDSGRVEHDRRMEAFRGDCGRIRGSGESVTVKDKCKVV